MRAHARLATEATDGGSRVSTLCSQAPLQLRLTDPKGADAWVDRLPDPVYVSLAAGAAGPVGGDDLALDVTVGAGTSLVFTDISPTLLLPGPDGATSHTTMRVRVCDGATLVWLPEPIIAAARCRHVNDVRIDLAPTARLLVREELVLGRHDELPGAVRQRLRVRRGDGPLHHQSLDVGPGAAGWSGAAVVGAHRAVGAVLVVDPYRGGRLDGAILPDTVAAVLPLAGPGVLVSAVADDSLSLRRSLAAGLAVLGTPWVGSETVIRMNCPPEEKESCGA